VILALGFSYWIVLEAGPYGQTVGKWVTGVRILYLGYLWAFIDDRRRTWHDSLADTVVIEADPSRKPSLGELLRSARAPR